MLITNKALLEQKNKRFIVYTFDANGRRGMSYGNLTIITATEYLLKVSKTNDNLIMEYKEGEVKIITELEHGLRRRATKQEILDFYEKTLNK